MSDNVNKSSGKGNRNKTSKPSQTASKSHAQSGSTAKKTGNTAKKPPLQSVNMNGRRNAGSKSRAVAPVTELEEKGYISRKKPDAVRDRNAEAKKDDIIIARILNFSMLSLLSPIMYHS